MVWKWEPKKKKNQEGLRVAKLEHLQLNLNSRFAFAAYGWGLMSCVYSKGHIARCRWGVIDDGTLH
jgi:hypothetical protein